MNPIRFKHHRFPAAMIVQAVRCYFRFTLSIRVVEALMVDDALAATIRATQSGRGGVF